MQEELFDRIEAVEQILIQIDSDTAQTLALEQQQAIEAIETSITRLLIALMLVTVWFLGLLIFSVIFFHRRITRPIKELVAANVAFADGRLEGPVPVGGQPEIAMLQSAFNRTVETINKQTAALVEQGRVADRIRARAVEAEQLAEQLKQQNEYIASQREALEQEIIERQQAEQAMMAARDAAMAANQAKSAFLATMSHELRTPLTAILGYSQLMEQALKAGDHQWLGNDLSRIRESGQHLNALISDVLDLSRIEAGKMSLSIGPVDVAQLVSQVVNTSRPLMARNSNTLEVRYEAAVGTIQSDEVKLRQVLLNLLSNAAKFTQQGRITVVIASDECEGAPGLRFDVIDTGIGIAPNKLQDIFETFTQLDNSSTRKYGGSGLGLPLSQTFCRMLGGDISVTSTEGQGSTFTAIVPLVSLPQAETAHVTNGEQATASEQTPARELQAGEQAPTGDILALVIDDDPDMGELLRRLFTTHNIEVVSTRSGAEGIELARDLLPDVMLLDVIMSDPDGWAVLAALKADPELATIPVIMISIDDQRQRGLTLGVVDYLVKPLDQERLLDLVKRYPPDHQTKPEQPSASLLIVEDDPALCQMFQRTCEREGWHVRTTPTGRDALLAMEAALPTVIVLDLMLPDVDGVQLIAQIQARPDWRHTPIVVLTARDLGPAERALLAGSVNKVRQKNDTKLDMLVDDLRRLIAEQTV
ncbi:MAG TPA: response regulator [Roseiflexaceae bacterium]|nr:response regulator [Roseiflexaceae bacterium]